MSNLNAESVAAIELEEIVEEEIDAPVIVNGGLSCQHHVSITNDSINDISPSLESILTSDNRSMGLSNESISNISSGCKRAKLKKLKSTLNLHDLSQNELELKASLYFHICNPLKRWRVERLVPYKLVLQIIKTIFLIIQVILFTYSSANDSFIFIHESQLIFNQLFIKKATNGTSTTAVYYSYFPSDIIDEVNYALERYYQLPNLTFGNYGYQLDSNGNVSPVVATLKLYKNVALQPSTGHFTFDSTLETIQFTINTTESSSLIEYLDANFTFNRFLELQLEMMIRSIHITKSFKIECFLFHSKVVYSKDSSRNKVAYHLELNGEHCNCNGTSQSNNLFIVFVVIDVIVIAICVISISFTIHNYHRGYTLAKAMGEFYNCKLRMILSWWERRHLFSMWHLFTSFSDVLLIIGSLLKMLLELNVNLETATVRMLLGSALIVQSGAMLRYFSFFKQLNALTRTLSAASPELIKFLVCTSLLYFAFALCGLVVFGAYNEEMFGNFGNSVEILFALINGDSIWLVFRAFNEDDLLIYIYSRFFVYTFIFLFIYAVLNLFTSLVKTSYDNSTMVDRASINEVRRFVFSGPLTPAGVALRDVTFVNKYVEPAVILSKRRRRRNESIGDLD